MNASKARTLDHFASPWIGPGAAPAGPSPACVAALEGDARFQRLRRRLEAAGFFAPLLGWQPVARTAAFLAAFGGAFALLLGRPAWPVRSACLLVVGFVLVQGCFFAHEAMHGAVSRRRGVTRLVGQLFDTLLVGFSFSYFCRSHELHHFHCNEATDPDTQSTLFSVFASSARQKRGLGLFITRWQHVLIPALFPIWALTLQWDGLTYVVRNRRSTRLDQIALLLHLALWFGLPAHFLGLGAAIVNYLGRSVVAGLYLGAVIPVNHLGRRAYDAEAGPGVLFLEQQLAATRNLGGSRLMDFLFMGLNSHIEHHLFPSVPTSRLRRGRQVTRAFCVEEGLPYHEQSFGAALGDAVGHLAAVARSARTPGQPDSAASDASTRATS